MGQGILLVFALLGQFALAAPMKVALVLDRGGKDDKSFNAAAFKGASEAKSKLGISLKDVEVSDESLFEPALRSFASKNFDLIIAIGITQAETVKKLSKEFPNQKFAIVDAPVEASNVKSLMFTEHEGSYLVGAVAAIKSKTNKIGFIGGMDIPLIRRFQMGFEQGVKSINPKAEVFINYIGVTGEAWNNPTKGKELALNQYSRGTDIIFVAAGNSNNGVFDAAEEKKLFAIGVDSNQNDIKPGRILTSMIKRVDTAVYETIHETQDGKFTGGIRYFNLKENGVDWTLDQYNKPLFTESEIKKITEIKQKIIAGKISVKDYYKINK